LGAPGPILGGIFDAPIYTAAGVDLVVVLLASDDRKC
jgi:hypothetical protein